MRHVDITILKRICRIGTCLFLGQDMQTTYSAHAENISRLQLTMHTVEQLLSLRRTDTKRTYQTGTENEGDFMPPMG